MINISFQNRHPRGVAQERTDSGDPEKTASFACRYMDSRRASALRARRGNDGRGGWFLLPFFIALCTASCPAPARAQLCDTPFEVIVTLRPPAFGFPTVWDSKYGMKESMVQLNSGIPQEGGTVFAIGRSLSQEDYKLQDIVMVELNRRGRALKTEKHPAKEAEDPVKMIRLGKEFVAVSNMRGGKGLAEKQVRFSWYDADGKYKREKIIRDATFDYEAMGLVRAVEADGFAAVLHAVNRSDPEDENGVLIRFSPAGGVLWKRAYRPGIPNAIAGLQPVAGDSYLATGRILLDDGRIAGWALKLGFDGAVQWQRTYPRGPFSVLRHAAQSEAKTAEGLGFIVSGDAEPYDGGPDAAWLMELSALGEPLWQRYFRRDDYALSGSWVRREDDGRAVLMMNAKAAEGGGGNDHVRILTLTPRGGIIGDEAYYEGLGARATDYTEGWNGERIFTAVIEDDLSNTEEDQAEIMVIGLAPDTEKEEEEPRAKGQIVHKGWILVATAPDPYTDPCAGHSQ